MNQIEINDRLMNGETLTFTNDTDVFEFFFSTVRGKIRMMKNGKMLNRNSLTPFDVRMVVELRNLQLEEI
jgi:hypothetical protein